MVSERKADTVSDWTASAMAAAKVLNMALARYTRIDPGMLSCAGGCPNVFRLMSLARVNNAPAGGIVLGRQ
jgi:hypothetical protein